MLHCIQQINKHLVVGYYSTSIPKSGHTNNILLYRLDQTSGCGSISKYTSTPEVSNTEPTEKDTHCNYEISHLLSSASRAQW